MSYELGDGRWAFHSSRSEPDPAWGFRMTCCVPCLVGVGLALTTALTATAQSAFPVNVTSAATLAPDAFLGPAVTPSRSTFRPPLRPFTAEGPLLARLSDPLFGPRARPIRALLRPQARPGDLLLPDPPRTLATASDLQCLAVAIYHEARDQSLDGQLAVASVILNRTEEPARWGATPCAVVAPVQFSFLSAQGGYAPIEDREAWAIAVEMAREALERGPSTLVGQADHYHTPAVDPDWDEDMDRVIQIGDHIFYADAMARG